jgi:hypothetical protein
VPGGPRYGAENLPPRERIGATIRKLLCGGKIVLLPAGCAIPRTGGRRKEGMGPQTLDRRRAAPDKPVNQGAPERLEFPTSAEQPA